MQPYIKIEKVFNFRRAGWQFEIKLIFPTVKKERVLPCNKRKIRGLLDRLLTQNRSVYVSGMEVRSF